MNELQLEILNSIRNLFNSGLSSSYISKKADISYTTVNELRNNKRSLEKVNFDAINRLYNLAVKENLNEENFNRKKLSDLNDGTNLKKSAINIELTRCENSDVKIEITLKDFYNFEDKTL
ncbi:hypothetical protein UMC2_33771 [[Clostridium] sordellii]|uniref:hypothetical protein n=1 Tax=Paraclostridium sordellii TaxID=1505 RepID=UPI0005428977|nr:hypothetical protein [Paeniclostridium sordellii]CEK36507.1 hypothetical protein UMC2_33771 [[Clostridium] sordellii] [Paeniclostridium sordellii]